MVFLRFVYHFLIAEPALLIAAAKGGFSVMFREVLEPVCDFGWRKPGTGPVEPKPLEDPPDKLTLE